MFLNNPSSTRSILANNENSLAEHRSSKPLSSENNGLKKKPFNENNNMTTKGLKTPHRNKDASGTIPNTQQSRRRALGDISNRKAVGGGGGANGKSNGLALKPSSITTQGLKPSSSNINSNKKALFPSSLPLNRFQPVKPLKFKSVSTSTSKTRLGSGASNNVQRASTTKTTTSATVSSRKPSEYDGIFGKTTRWSQPDEEYEKYGSAFRVSQEELDEVSNLRQEMCDRIKHETIRNIRMEQEAMDEEWNRKEKDILEKDVKDLGLLMGNVDLYEEDGMSDLLAGFGDDDDSVYDPAEERRLSGSDPFSMWGDI